jgi:cell division protein FtsL
MADKRHTKKQPRPRSGFLTKVVILVLLGAIGWQLHSLQGQLKTVQAEKERFAAEVAAQQQENDALAADIAEGPTEEKIEEIARDELGYVKPGEYIFEPGN